MLGRRLEIANLKARRVFKIYHKVAPELIKDEDAHTYLGGVETTLGTYRKTKVPCSKFCCGNPRRHRCKAKEKLTVQERRMEEWAKSFFV